MKKIILYLSLSLTCFQFTHADTILDSSSICSDAQIKTCFTPYQRCTNFITSEILQAKDVILVQAYSFTSKEITDALINAKKTGISVKVLLDKSNVSGKGSKMQELKDAGIDVKIDEVSGIAHNKIIIIDDQRVLTGSFNFSKNADTKNVENLLYIDDRSVAYRYRENFYRRWEK